MDIPVIQASPCMLRTKATSRSSLRARHLSIHVEGLRLNIFESSLVMAPVSASELVRVSSTDLIGLLLDEAFIDQSNQTLSYEQYFVGCAPFSCYYTCVKNNDNPYIVAALFSLYGGLTIISRFII